MRGGIVRQCHLVGGDEDVAMSGGSHSRALPRTSDPLPMAPSSWLPVSCPPPQGMDITGSHDILHKARMSWDFLQSMDIARYHAESPWPWHQRLSCSHVLRQAWTALETMNSIVRDGHQRISLTLLNAGGGGIRPPYHTLVIPRKKSMGKVANFFLLFLNM